MAAARNHRISQNLRGASEAPVIPTSVEQVRETDVQPQPSIAYRVLLETTAIQSGQAAPTSVVYPPSVMAAPAMTSTTTARKSSHQDDGRVFHFLVHLSSLYLPFDCQD